MSRRTVVSGALAYVVAPDERVPVAERWSALATGQVIDEVTGRAPATPLVGRTDRPDVTVSSGGDGTFCLVARPWIACPPLLAASYTITATIEVTGYLPMEIIVAVPSRQRTLVPPGASLGNAVITLDTVAGLVPGQLLAIGPPSGVERARIHHLGPGPQQVTLTGGLGLPHAIGSHVVADAWTPVDLGIVGLRRPPVVVRGRAIRRNPATNTTTPVPLASITLVDFWSTLASLRASLPGAMTDPSPAKRAFLVAVSPGLVAPRDVSLGKVNRQDLLPVPLDERLLVGGADVGSASLRISDRNGLASGAVLQLDPDDGEIGESVTVTAVSGLGPPTEEGELTLALPLRASHRAGARTRRALPQAAAVSVALRRDVRPLDRALFVADATSLPDDIHVRVSGGTAAPERQHAGRFEATADASGYFELPPVHRVAALKLHATAPALAPVDVTFHPEYGPPENWVDVVFA